MKNEIASNYIMKAKIHLRFFIPGIYKFTVTVDLQKMREINNRFALKFVSANIFTKSKDGWDWERLLKAVWPKLLGQAGTHSWLSRRVSQWLFNISKDWRHATCPGQPVLVCDPPHGEKSVSLWLKRTCYVSVYAHWPIFTLEELHWFWRNMMHTR